MTGSPPTQPDGLTVRLDLPPTGNNMYFNNARGGRSQAQEMTDWKDSAGWLVKAALGPLPPPTPPYRVDLFVYFDGNRRDLDNVIKPTLDAIIPVLGGNDRRVVEIHAYRRIDRDAPRLDVVIRTVQ